MPKKRKIRHPHYANKASLTPRPLTPRPRQLIGRLKTNGIDIYEAYVFGSVAMGKEDEYSDIDIAIVSEAFIRIPFYDVKKVSKFRRAIDLRLEVHPFSLNDISNDPPLFFADIKNKGIRVS